MTTIENMQAQLSEMKAEQRELLSTIRELQAQRGTDSFDAEALANVQAIANDLSYSVNMKQSLLKDLVKNS